MAVGFMRPSSAAAMRCCVFGGQRDVERHEVGFREKLLERDVGHPMFARERGIFERIEREDAHIKSPSAFCDLLADSSQTDDTDRGPTDLATEQEERTPGLPLAITDVGYRLWNAARGSEQQRPGVIGGRVGQHLRACCRQAHRARWPRGRRCCRSRPRSSRSPADSGAGRARNHRCDR